MAWLIHSAGDVFFFLFFGGSNLLFKISFNASEVFAGQAKQKNKRSLIIKAVVQSSLAGAYVNVSARTS